MEYINLNTDCSTSYTTIGNKIVYTISCINQSSISFQNIFISNKLNQSLKFITDSVVINNIEMPGLNILTGFSIGRLYPNKKTTIRFEVEAISKDLDSVNITTNADCIYEKDGFRKSIIYTSDCSIQVYNPSIYIKKSCSKENASLNDIITYKIKVVNNGDVYLDNIILKDDICDYLGIIEGSFKVNSHTINDVDLDCGINIGDLNINDYKIIEYDVIVNGHGVACSVSSNAYAEYSYYLNNGFIGNKKSEVSNCILNILLPSFKQIYIENYAYLPEKKEDIKCVENINTDVEIKHYNVIKTPVAKSSDGISLSGYKLIIHGVINQIIRYSVEKSNRPIHSFEHKIPFSTFIILPYNYNFGSNVQIEYKEEYTHCDLVNPRCIFENISILLIAKTLK
ncbi:SPOCS domain-containing protein [Paraclostridium dentum]|uniref:SPOCS domain-containing protein n=1 Tax=Paraclostridium dentum TaxID=2662455 RepID=UPI003F2A199E